MIKYNINIYNKITIQGIPLLNTVVLTWKITFPCKIQSTKKSVIYHIRLRWKKRSVMGVGGRNHHHHHPPRTWKLAFWRRDRSSRQKGQPVGLFLYIRVMPLEDSCVGGTQCLIFQTLEFKLKTEVLKLKPSTFVTFILT